MARDPGCEHAEAICNIGDRVKGGACIQVQGNGFVIVSHLPAVEINDIVHLCPTTVHVPVVAIERQDEPNPPGNYCECCWQQDERKKKEKTNPKRDFILAFGVIFVASPWNLSSLGFPHSLHAHDNTRGAEIRTGRRETEKSSLPVVQLLPPEHLPPCLLIDRIVNFDDAVHVCLLRRVALLLLTKNKKQEKHKSIRLQSSKKLRVLHFKPSTLKLSTSHLHLHFQLPKHKLKLKLSQASNCPSKRHTIPTLP